MTAAPTRAVLARATSGALPHPVRVIAVASGKGGVGKTSIVANLGLELAKGGASVRLVEGMPGQGDLSILFGLDPRRGSEEGSHEVAPRLHLVSASAAWASVDDAPLRSPGADFLLIDTGPGITPTVLDRIALAERTLVVTTHEPTAVAAALALLQAARDRGAGRLEVIVNMAASHVAARETHTRLCRLTARSLGFSPGLAAVIPRDGAVGEAIVRQRPLTLIYPYAQATRAVAALARTLTNHEDNHHERTRISLALRDRW